MSFTLDKIFTTATAITDTTDLITEIAPCDELKPYVRCFWEAKSFSDNTEQRIIPDCCADLLIYSWRDKVRCDYCGVSNRSFVSRGNVRTFGIRFYAWSVALFSSVDMKGTLNGYFPAEAVFDNFNEAAERIVSAKTTPERIAVAQNFLIRKLRCSRQNNDVMNSMYKIVSSCARVDVQSLAYHSAVSARTLERSFRNYTGVSPKEMIDLIRYQLLWQQCIKPRFDLLDSVDKFGYYDAAHLYNDFKKFHGISLPQALEKL